MGGGVSGCTRAASRRCAVGLATGTRSVTGRVRLDGIGVQRSAEVGPQRVTKDVGPVDAVTIGALLEQLRELVVHPGVDGG